MKDCVRAVFFIFQTRFWALVPWCLDNTEPNSRTKIRQSDISCHCMEIISHFCTEIASLSDQLRDISIQGKKKNILHVTFSLLIITNYKKGGRLYWMGLWEVVKAVGKPKRWAQNKNTKSGVFMSCGKMKVSLFLPSIRVNYSFVLGCL